MTVIAVSNNQCPKHLGAGGSKYMLGSKALGSASCKPLIPGSTCTWVRASEGTGVGGMHCTPDPGVLSIASHPVEECICSWHSTDGITLYSNLALMIIRVYLPRGETKPFFAVWLRHEEPILRAFLSGPAL